MPLTTADSRNVPQRLKPSKKRTLYRSAESAAPPKILISRELLEDANRCVSFQRNKEDAYDR
jgi:hypothetical protein